MKPVFLKFTDHEGKVIKTFTTSSLKTGMMDNIFDLAERADKLEREDVAIPEVRAFYNDLKSIILAIFGYQFSLDELNDNVEIDEVMAVFQDICTKLGGEFRKN